MRCQEYDFIEIVCLFHYPVRLTLKSGESLEGTALDTVWDDARQECLTLKQGKTVRSVVLASLMMLEVLVENPHFQLARFD
ncbi:Rho-binding antiterminator [Ferrimonas balearica]|uniref:Rho-binding antiterminator n=1 Tax=Ferrimonas balearica TaxID=44012 RepID=UPI001C99B512|nr:Rho-binding antiterminator [Ferrimonas balearica]MBY5922602.1 Rho-binding antiterminator [Ferrimonas balearica]MBY5995586.1 Rho-binding antiterminator [Ferrimonas balearica]